MHTSQFIVFEKNHLTITNLGNVWIFSAKRFMFQLYLAGQIMYIRLTVTQLHQCTILSDEHHNKAISRNN